MSWRAVENGVEMRLSDPQLPSDFGGFGLKDLVQNEVRARPGFEKGAGDLEWTWEPESYASDLWWLPADHGPTVDLRIRVELMP